jgi:hypothetical protein
MITIRRIETSETLSRQLQSVTRHKQSPPHPHQSPEQGVDPTHVAIKPQLMCEVAGTTPEQGLDQQGEVVKHTHFPLQTPTRHAHLQTLNKG